MEPECPLRGYDVAQLIGVDTACNRNEYKKYLVGRQRRLMRRADNPQHIHRSNVSKSWEYHLLEPYTPVQSCIGGW